MWNRQRVNKTTYDLQFDSLAVELDGLDLEINAEHRMKKHRR
jgi:hypothetical protein